MVYAIVLGVVVTAVVLAAAAERHFDEHGVYIGRPKAFGKPNDLAAFALEISRETHVELACGGCLQDPQHAADELRSRYGKREMFRRCIAVVFSPENPETQPAVWSAYEILDRQGDARLLQQLMAMRAEWLAQPDPERTPRLACLEKLIVALCVKLDQLPPGIPELQRRHREELEGW